MNMNSQMTADINVSLPVITHPDLVSISISSSKVSTFISSGSTSRWNFFIIKFSTKDRCKQVYFWTSVPSLYLTRASPALYQYLKRNTELSVVELRQTINNNDDLALTALTYLNVDFSLLTLYIKPP